MTGYRDDNLFGSGNTNPIDVIYFECKELGNTDIPTYMVNHPRELTGAQIDYLRQIANGASIDEFRLKEIIKFYIEKRNYCIWLCNSPKDVYDAYIDRTCSNTEKPEYKKYKKQISKYTIPKDAIILSDCGIDGKLYAWQKKYINKYR